MNIYLFGKTSLSGESFFNYFKLKNSINKIYCFSRDKNNPYPFDLKKPKSFSLKNNEDFLIISFAPIWDLSEFLKYFSNFEKSMLRNLKGIIACSSTSALTKKFEFNSFDKNLSSKLLKAEKEIFSISQKLEINCQIIRPTMIYGSVNGKSDKNISKILFIMRNLRFIIIPSESGLRQPVHASQLAEVVYSLMEKSLVNENNKISNLINLGGDQILNYKQMIQSLKNSLCKSDKGNKCLIISIPNRLFFILVLPLMIFSPKNFAALLRICSDLAGFTKSCLITESEPKIFPIIKNKYR